MRTRINNITFTPGTRSIITGITDLTIDDIRLFVNESQMKVICSSMQKSNIDSIVSGVVTYKNIFPVLAAGDHITFEIDKGDNVAKEANATANKNEIIAAIPTVNQIQNGLSTLTSVSNISDKIGTAPVGSDKATLFAWITSLYNYVVGQTTEDIPEGLGDRINLLLQFFGLTQALPQFTYATDQEVIDIVDDVYNAYFPNN